MGVTSTETARQGVRTDSNRAQPPTSQVTIVACDHELAEVIATRLNQSGDIVECRIITAKAVISSRPRLQGALVYLPSLRKDGMVPDLVEAANLFNACDEYRFEHFVLVSSAAAYGASFRNPGLVSESYRRPKDKCVIASNWGKLESIAKAYLKDVGRLTVLRCATLMSARSANLLTSCFVRRTTTIMPGHDPSIQLLSPADLAQAIGCVLQTRTPGFFNVAPNMAIPLQAALKRSGIKRIPLPRTFLRIAQAIHRGSTASHLDYERYSWTVSNEKIKAIGFRPEKSSVEALDEFRRSIARSNHDVDNPHTDQFDEFGMDKRYIAAYGRTLFRFLADWYWRIEVAGLEHIPPHGRGILAGIHRGFMPWDGVMALDLIVKKTGRYPRFLIHPGLVRFPFLANFMTKLGGIIACQENAKRVLEGDELLGVFPEGIQGAFVRYSRAYQIHDFHRDAFVKMALRHRAPIIPFVTVGSAEIFPILWKLKSRVWTRYSEWPEFPITPTFPLIPLPLPSKWHTRFLPAMHIENDYPASVATNSSVVRAISCEVRNRMQKAIDEMLQRRRSVFFGSVFAVETK
jgi:1-acyl-sn-glycerol-3-phosphate acyltransferase/nucleoside-diphosphate-sugar epimerase